MSKSGQVGSNEGLFGQEDATLRRLTSPGLQALAGRMLGQWPEATRLLPAAADSSSFFFVEMFTSVPVTIPPSRAVALLGDAAHTMAPPLGRGANLALRDGARLGRALERVARGLVSLTRALAEYEAEMAAYGFDVVRQPAATGARLMGQHPLPAVL